jgi:septum formation protein
MDIDNYKIVLGSQSPRRSQLIRGLDIDFEVRVIETDESYPDSLLTDAVAEYIAIAKAAAHTPTLKDNELLITADTVVAYNDKIFGKPKDKAEAIRVLTMLSDSIHTVYTGVCIKTVAKQHSFTSKSQVKFSSITKEEAAYYFNKYNPVDKAGSYGIQEWLGYTKVEWIAGSYNNIIGLPTAQLYDELKKFVL